MNYTKIKFKDRKRELRELNETVESKGFKFEIIYGRRRFGKTELILNATKHKKRIYYLATEENNLRRFYSACAAVDPEINNLNQDYEVIFEHLKNNFEIIIIDEFQNLVKENANFLSIFQSIIDTKLKESNIKLFILGSSVSIMTSKVLGYKSPVYGRKTASLKLKPVSFFDLKEFFPKYSFEQIVDIYGFADGIPYYLILIDTYFWKWIDNELTMEKGFLKDEVDFLMRFEFTDSSTYKLILEAIANGKNKMGEIKDYMKIQRTDIMPYLRNLIEVDFVKREVPITENVKSRMGRYFLKDNFLRFWFRFIYPNLSTIEQRIFKPEAIKRAYNSYLGFVFENICMQYLILKQMDYSRIGRWWYKDKEIDIVALNDMKNEALFCECKWQEKVNAEKILFELRDKAKHVNWNNSDRKEKYAIFAKSFKEKIKEKDVSLFDLNDIEKAFGLS